MATIKGQLKQKTANGSDILHPETEAGLASYSYNSTDTQDPKQATNTQQALDRIINAGIGVSDVQNGNETSLVENSVATITPANIGAVAVNNNNLTGDTKCKITYDSKGLVTAGDDLAVTDLPDNIPTSKITGLGAAAAKGVVTSSTGISSSSTDNDLATAKAVWKAIDELPEPMVFKGTLGTNGTITTLPTPATGASGNEGHTYKVITAGTYASTDAKVGDVFTSTGSAWVLIPSGDVDTDTDTWRGIKVNGTPKLGNGINSGDVDFVNGGNVTVSFNSTGNKITLGVAANHSIPSDDDQAAWSAKQDALAAQTAYSAKGTTTKVPQITTNALGQVTKIEEKTIAFPNITVTGPQGGDGGNAVTAIAVDSTDKHKLIVYKTQTFLTASDITGKTDKSTLTTKGDIYYASAASTPARLGIGSEGQALTVGSSGVPVWANLPASFAVKVVENNATLTQQEYDDFIARKLALLPDRSFNSTAIPSFYMGMTSNDQVASGSPCTLASASYNESYGGVIRTYYSLQVSATTKVVSMLQAYTVLTGNISTDTPTSGSKMFLSAGGAYTALDGKANKASPTAGVYSAVQINSEGIVTAGKQLWEVIDNGGDTSDIVIGGLYFEKALAS